MRRTFQQKPNYADLTLSLSVCVCVCVRVCVCVCVCSQPGVPDLVQELTDVKEGNEQPSKEEPGKDESSRKRESFHRRRLTDDISMDAIAAVKPIVLTIQ